jgi:tRNA threonylcarbamoyladenosine biosynthesis protein TsaB
LPPKAASNAPIVLAIDTSAAHCAAALLWGHREPGLSEVSRIVTCSEDMAKGQAERLLPMVEEFLAQHGLVWADLTLLAVGIGPGNFTGIRIAISLVRGLALGLNIPALGVSGFTATAFSGGLPFPYWAVINAPRGQAYVQRFPDGTPQLVDGPQDVAALDAPVLHCADLSPNALVAAIAEVASMTPTANAPRPAPLYLRPADAAPPSDPPPTILP